jgi:hypothetical protein
MAWYSCFARLHQRPGNFSRLAQFERIVSALLVVQMKRICLILLMLSASASGQSLPGPAASGWFVLMGRHESLGNCQAQIQPSSNRDARDINGGNGEYPGLIPLTTKRFGPYSTFEAARDALTAAGWQCLRGQLNGLCYALEGC